MSWPIWCEIVCRQCASTEAGRFNTTTLNKKQMKAVAMKRGWRIINDDWVCRHCLAKQIESSVEVS